MSDTTLTRPRSRYPGSPPFEDLELDRKLFFGRADDAEAILHSILSHDLFVLYARSGIGKTSILRAGVMHDLRERKMWPVVVRLHDTTRSPLELVRSSLVDAGNDGRVEVLGVDEGAENLWDLLAGLEIWRTEDDVLLLPVLIFDQFEELFTLWDPVRREAFIAQFANVVRRIPPRADSKSSTDARTRAPRAKFVLSLREDFLGGLEAFSPHLPQILTNRQRLQPLTRDQAEEAIREPALLDDDLDSPAFVYDDDTVEMILDFLGESQSGATGYDTEAAIEAFQLQILCHHIEFVVLRDKLDAAAASENSVADESTRPRITPNDIGGAEGLSSILKRNYSSEVEKISSSARRRRIRRLCEVGLIRDGRRRFVAKNDLTSQFRVSDDDLAGLIDARLLRSESRGGTTYYELAHDSLVDPLLEYRAERQRRNLRWAMAAGLLLLLVAAVVLAVWVWSANQSDGSNDAEELTLGLGTTLPESVEAGAPPDTVNMTLGANDVSVDKPAVLQVKSGDVELEVVGTAPSGTEQLVPTSSGSFVVLVEPGDYRASVQPLDGAKESAYELALSTEAPKSIADQQTFVQLEEGELALYEFDVEPGRARSLMALLRGVEGATVDVIGPGAGRVPLADEAASAAGEIRTVPAFEEGGYLVVLVGAPDSAGTYELQLRTSDIASLADERLDGEISSPGEVDLYVIAPNGNNVVSLELESGSSLDAVVDVIDATGNVVAGVDSTGPGGAEGLAAVVVPEAEWYLVRVEGESETVGAYSLRSAFSQAERIAAGAKSDDPELSAPGQIDRYTFTGDIGEALTVDVAGEIDAVINLVGPTGERLSVVDENGAGAPETMTAILTQAGSYIIEISGFDDAEGQYSVALDLAPSTPIDSNTTETFPVDESRSTDVYTFSGVSRDAIALTVDLGDDADGVLRLLSPSGRLLAEQLAMSSGVPSTLTEVLPSTGAYIVQVVRSTAGSAGSYELRLDTDPVRAIGVDGDVGGEISDAGEVDVFTFAGAAGDVMTLTMDDVAPGLNGVLDVLLPDGEVLASVDGETAGASETTTLLLPDGGTYVVQVRGFTDSTGEYTLRLRRAAVEAMKIGSRRSPEIEGVADVDVFTIAGVAGDVVTFEVEPTAELDASVSIVDPEGDEIAAADARLSGFKESLTVVYPTDGLFRAVVTGAEQSVGEYSFAVTEGVLVPFEIGSSKMGSIDEVGAVDGYSFEGSTGQEVSITVKPEARLDTDVRLDGRLTIFDPRADQLTSVDNLADKDATETITLVLPQGGEYTLLVSGFVSTGPYTLSIEEVQIRSLEYGESSGPVVIERDDTDTFTFAGSQGDRPLLSVGPSAEFDVVVETVDVNTGAVFQTFNQGGPGIEERVRLTLPEDRDYFVRIRGATGSAGTYTVTLLPPGT